MLDINAQLPKVVCNLTDKDVRAYTEHGLLIEAFPRYVFDKDKWRSEQTYVIDAGCMDGEKIDLFDLQDWFDKNREWINELRKQESTIIAEGEIGK